MTDKYGGKMKTVVTLIIAALMFCQNSFGKQEDDISFDKGDFLYEALGNDKLAGMKEELPVKICVVRDDNGWQEIAELTETGEIEAAIQSFMDIRIGEKTDICVTDRYNSISFVFEDGEKVELQLNDVNLEWKKNDKFYIYELEGIPDFWKIAYQKTAGEVKD